MLVWLLSAMFRSTSIGMFTYSLLTLLHRIPEDHWTKIYIALAVVFFYNFTTAIFTIFRATFDSACWLFCDGEQPEIQLADLGIEI